MDSTDGPVAWAATALGANAATAEAIAIGTYAAAGGIAGSKILNKPAGGGSGASVPTVRNAQTAEPLAAMSEQDKRNKQFAASQLTKDWAKPTLGKPGLLGL